MEDVPMLTQIFSFRVGGRKEAARLLGKGVRAMGAWISGDNTPNDSREVIFMINEIKKRTNNQGYGVSIEDLERLLRLDLSHLKKLEAVLNATSELWSLLDTLAYFERLALSTLDSVWKLERRGRPVNSDKNEVEMCADAHTFKGRMVDFIREKYKLGGKDRYQQADEIWKGKREDLMQAVHVGLIPMSDAQKLLVIIPADTSLQGVLSSGNKKAIQMFMKERGLK